MRQRASAASTPPRSADSDYSKWSQGRRGSKTGYQRANSSTNSVGGMPESGDGDGATEGVGGGGGHPRRRRAAHNQQHTSTTVERHSPQHYLAEYNKNYGGVDGVATASSPGNESISAPHSTGGLPASSFNRHHQHSTATSSYRHYGAYNHNSPMAASEVYYSQYHNHHDPQQPSPVLLYDNDHHASNNMTPLGVAPSDLRRNNSVPNAHKLSFQHFEKSFHMDPNPLAAVHFRRALHVPDRQYREYIHGHGRDSTPLLNPICCANICAGFSLVGFLFMIFIGILLDTQPLFIAGTLPSALKENDSGRTSTIYFVTAERLPAASNAYQASCAYLTTLVACLVFVYYERVDSMFRRRLYQDIPDAVSATGGSTAGIVGEGLPETVADAVDQQQPDYQVTAWNRLAGATFTVRAREWAGAAAARIWNGRGATNPSGRRRKVRTKNNAKTV